MTSKGSWDSLAGPLISWAIGLGVLVAALGAAMVKYIDLFAPLGRLR